MAEDNQTSDITLVTDDRILIVDDSATQLELLRFLLEKAGYSVATAVNGADALALAQQSRFELVISDIVMPVMNGYELCRRLKQDPRNHGIAVMLLTRLADVEDIIVGLESEADYYVTKPYSEEFLLSRVRLFMGRKMGRRIDDERELMVTLAGKSYTVSAERPQILNFLVSTYENAIQRNRELMEAQSELRISNQLLAEQTAKAQEAEDNYLTVLHHNPDAVLVLDSQKRICFMNNAARDLLGHEEREVLRTVHTLPLFTGITTEVELEGENGQTIVAELRVVETSWAGQAAMLASLRDITGRRNAEKRILEQQQQLYEANKQLQRMVMLDVMTGLNNFRAFKERLAEEVARSRRYGTTLSLMLLDVDRFKSYNDEFGHPAGDELLSAVAAILRKHVRHMDFPARYGGEEFVILLPSTEAVGAVDLAERLRDAIERTEWKSRSITASFGVATLTEEMVDGAALLAAADQAMYHSKFGGRNRVTHFQDLEAESGTNGQQHRYLAE